MNVPLSWLSQKLAWACVGVYQEWNTGFKRAYDLLFVKKTNQDS